MRERIKRFTRALTLPSAHDCIGWWEARRLLYNLIVMPGFALSVGLSLLMAGKTVPQLISRPGLAVMVLAVVVFVGANAFYTLGWASEILWTGGQTSITRPYRKLVFWTMTSGSLLLCVVPMFGVALLWLIGAR